MTSPYWAWLDGDAPERGTHQRAASPDRKAAQRVSTKSKTKTSQPPALTLDADPGPPLVLSDQQATAFLHLRPGSLARMRSERRGPAWSYVGRRVVYLRADLLAFLTANRVEPVAQR